MGWYSSSQAGPCRCKEIITNFKITLRYSAAKSQIQEAINIDVQSIIHGLTDVTAVIKLVF